MTTEERLKNLERKLSAAKRRNRWMLTVVLIMFASLYQQSIAMIFETSQECQKRYGEPARVYTNNVIAYRTTTNRGKDAQLYIFFSGDRAYRLMYSKNDHTPFDGYEMMGIIKAHTDKLIEFYKKNPPRKHPIGTIYMSMSEKGKYKWTFDWIYSDSGSFDSDQKLMGLGGGAWRDEEKPYIFNVQHDDK